MKKYVFLALAAVGIVLPMSQFIPASLDGEFSVSAMMQKMFASRTIAGVSLDFAVTALTALLFGVLEAVRLRMRTAWIALAGSFLIGFSFGLPFLLFLRERALERASRVEEAAQSSIPESGR
ncbi:DUF2834 domain-containing protein [Salinispira pacifica]